jgi:hypothetical protein
MLRRSVTEFLELPEIMQPIAEPREKNGPNLPLYRLQRAETDISKRGLFEPENDML